MSNDQNQQQQQQQGKNKGGGGGGGAMNGINVGATVKVEEITKPSTMANYFTILIVGGIACLAASWLSGPSRGLFPGEPEKPALDMSNTKETMKILVQNNRRPDSLAHEVFNNLTPEQQQQALAGLNQRFNPNKGSEESKA